MTGERKVKDKPVKESTPPITDIKIVLRRLKEAQKLNTAIISSIGDGVIIVDEYGLITEVNRAALDMLGYKKAEMIGQWFPKILPSKDKDGNDTPTLERPAVRSLLSGKAAREITSYARKDGSLIPVDGTASPFMIDGKPRGSMIVFRDVSHEVAIEKAKDEFVSLASHQLRTPLTSMNLYLQIIRDEQAGLSDSHLNYLRKIEASTITMLELIDDFLNVSKLELGKLDLRLTEVNVTALVSDQLERIETIAQDNNIKIINKVSNKKLIAKTDRKLLAEAIYNLLTNAIRYRCQSSPKIELSITSTTKVISIFIKDNGIGIPDSAQAKIFDRLYRADNARDAQSEGTGLGLYLVHKIMLALGGEVGFKSTSGKGTTFFLSIPSSK